MSGGRIVVLEITRLEAAHLSGLLTQFTQLLAESADLTDAPPADPAVARLVPDAYSDPDEASEFRRITERELLDHRAADAETVLQTLTVRGSQLDPATLTGDVEAVMAVALDADAARAWLRTLAALRLVLASRLGIQHEDDHDEDDPRFGIYDWLGYRLDGLVQALDAR